MNYKQIKAIEEKKQREEQIKKLCPTLDNGSGIYCFFREDENGFRYAYVGLATKSLLSRCADHLLGYPQHIDKSIKKRGLYSNENPYGWKLKVLCYCSEDECDTKEQYYIKKVHQSGRQLLNSTSGSQGKGKRSLDNQKSPKGYYDGLRQGYKNAQRFVSNLFDKHLNYSKKSEKPNKNQEKALEKFAEFLNWSDE